MQAVAWVSFAMEKRNVGIVFQSYAIWPHMSAVYNIAYPRNYGGRLRGLIQQEMGQQVYLHFAPDLCRPLATWYNVL